MHSLVLTTRTHTKTEAPYVLSGLTPTKTCKLSAWRPWTCRRSGASSYPRRTVFDLVAPTYHVTVLFAFSPPNPTDDVLIDALAATLPHFPLLTARLELRCRPDHPRRRPFFVTGKGGAGALVVEAAVSSALSDHLRLVPSPDLALLHTPVDKGTPHLLQLQINRFACGGPVIASSAHRQAADGYSMSTFFYAWVDRPVPYGPGGLVPRCPPRCEFEHRGAEFLPLSSPHKNGASSRQAPVRVDPSEITNMLLHCTSGFVAKLKARAQNRYTTFETVSAHLWKKITVARGRVDDAAHTSLNVSVNGRARLGTDAVPRGFFGNVVLTAKSWTSARDLARGSLADAAALVRAGVLAVDRMYFQSFIDFGVLHGDEELEPFLYLYTCAKSDTGHFSLCEAFCTVAAHCPVTYFDTMSKFFLLVESVGIVAQLLCYANQLIKIAQIPAILIVSME
ncbi:tryptamine hydroxycinnamoyltransferase 1-like [Phragmites australis]|uniref:tryptamine hydroxycinnamoyltransferase 1-like n=1 Tax=Phragmites australis TaxID=29695 RepID=UPI002D779421|nr:tryptamine hydroxycinnamoyltransferase 1-like [Phragmites australis]